MLLGELIVFCIFTEIFVSIKTLNSELTSLDNFIMKNFSFRLLMLVLVVNVSGLIAQVYASPITLQQVQNNIQSFMKQRGASLTASSLHRV